VDGLVAASSWLFSTAISYAELSDIYPRAGSGSSYYFAEAALLEKGKSPPAVFPASQVRLGWIPTSITGSTRVSWWPFPRL